MSDPGGDRRLADATLACLAETDELADRMADARNIRERMGAGTAALPLPDEAVFERALRALAADGLIDATIEPYIPPRYRITRKGRMHAKSERAWENHRDAETQRRQPLPFARQGEFQTTNRLMPSFRTGVLKFSIRPLRIPLRPKYVSICAA